MKSILIPKTPVVVILGHIDHGKTSLLLAIRKLSFTGEKPGGEITQHLGAYQIERQGRKITFLDTPGHEAFSQLRSRGAKVADIAILVVDSSEGVKSQTREAILQINQNKIPCIVAISKIDKPQANPEKVKRELKEAGILIEEYGGKTPVVFTSAKTGFGIEDLLDMILLVAEIQNLKTDPNLPPEGFVLEASLDKRKGVLAGIILNQGEIKLGDILGTQSAVCKVKRLEDWQGKNLKEGSAGDPLLVIGFEEIPKPGEIVRKFNSIEEARENLKKEEERKKVFYFEEEKKVLNIILKADVLGSLEAIESILENLKEEKVIIRILKKEVGEVKISDVELAKVAKAFILAFRVGVDSVAFSLAKREKVKIFSFFVIYDLVEKVRKILELILQPKVIKKETGRMKVLVEFWQKSGKQIVGARVEKGEIKKGFFVEIWRNQELLGEGKIHSLQRNKKDIEVAKEKDEIGILVEAKEKIEKGDVLVAFIKEKPSFN
jgi:translation initiation factor IF-2